MLLNQKPVFPTIGSHCFREVRSCGCVSWVLAWLSSSHFCLPILCLRISRFNRAQSSWPHSPHFLDSSLFPNALQRWHLPYLVPNPVKHLIQELVTLTRSHKMDLRPHIAVLLGFEHLFFVAFSRLQNLKIIWKIFMSVSLYNFVACKFCIKSGDRVISYHLFVFYIVKCLKILLEWPSLPSLAFWGKETKIRLFSASYKKLVTHPPI